MSFWQSDLGEISGKAEDAFSPAFVDVIPDGTKATARIIKFFNEVNTKTNYRCLSIEWELMDGNFKGMHSRQKLKVIEPYPGDKDWPKTRHRALNMLTLIYNMFNIKPTSNDIPSDHDLSSFNGKIAGIVIRETKPNDEGKTYNYVSEVHPSQGFKAETGVKIEVTHSRTNIESAFSRNPSGIDESLEDDVPF